MKMEQTECSETSVYKIQTPGNYPKESIQQIGLLTPGANDHSAPHPQKYELKQIKIICWIYFYVAQ